MTAESSLPCAGFKLFALQVETNQERQEKASIRLVLADVLRFSSSDLLNALFLSSPQPLRASSACQLPSQAERALVRFPIPKDCSYSLTTTFVLGSQWPQLTANRSMP